MITITQWLFLCPGVARVHPREDREEKNTLNSEAKDGFGTSAPLCPYSNPDIQLNDNVDNVL